MFCPVCKAEYRKGFTRCSDCAAELVSSLKQEDITDKPPELVWRGSDPVAFSRVIAVLRAAGVPHHVNSDQDHLVFRFAIPRPRYQVRVPHSCWEVAQELVAPIEETLPFASSLRPQAVAGDSDETPARAEAPRARVRAPKGRVPAPARGKGARGSRLRG